MGRVGADQGEEAGTQKKPATFGDYIEKNISAFNIIIDNDIIIPVICNPTFLNVVS